MANVDNRHIHHALHKLWSVKEKKWLTSRAAGYTLTDHFAGSFTLPQATEIITQRGAKGEELKILDVNSRKPV